MSRKNIKTAVFYIFLLFASILYLSCSMFTESWAKRAVRNQYDVLKNASTKELADIAGEAQFSHPDTAAAIMDLLGEKGSALRDLSVQKKEKVLTASMSASIPLSSLKKLADNNVFLSGGGTPSSNSALIKNLSAAVNRFNPHVFEIILQDPEAMRSADPASLANATAAAFLQLIYSAGFENIKNNIVASGSAVDVMTQDTDTVITKMLGTVSNPAYAKNAKTLIAAVEAAKLLSGATGAFAAKDANRTPVVRNVPSDVKVLGVLPFSDILAALK